jgi:DNA-binding GntR family transcriptional regulator
LKRQGDGAAIWKIETGDAHGKRVRNNQMSRINRTGRWAGEELHLRLVADIVSGRLAAGTALHEKDLAQEYHISRTPVRQVIHMLEGQGLVHIEPGVGVRVREISLREALEVFEVRQILEPFVARAAALHCPAEGRRQLEALLVQLSDPALANDLERHGELDVELHRLICELSGNETASDILSDLILRTHMAFSFLGSSYYKSSYENLAACRRGSYVMHASARFCGAKATTTSL